MILDGSYTDLLSATASKSSFLLDDEENIKIDKKNFKLVKNYYKSCLDIEINSDNVLTDFFKDISTINLEITSLEQQNLSFRITQKTMDIISYPKSDGVVIEVGGLFTIEISPDEYNKKKMSILLYPPSEFVDADIAPLKDQGSEKLFELTSSLFGVSNKTERDRNRLTWLTDADLDILSDDKIYSVIDDAVTVQNRLFKLYKKRSVTRIFLCLKKKVAF